MRIKKRHDVPLADLQGYANVTKQIVLGPADGSNEIVLRYFSLGPDGTSPQHSHPFPHLVKVEAGTGVIIDAQGEARPLQAADYIFIDENEPHQLRNTGPEPFEFICIVPRRGET